jgi:hypothetical protein
MGHSIHVTMQSTTDHDCPAADPNQEQYLRNIALGNYLRRCTESDAAEEIKNSQKHPKITAFLLIPIST